MLNIQIAEFEKVLPPPARSEWNNRFDALLRITNDLLKAQETPNVCSDPVFLSNPSWPLPAHKAKPARISTSISIVPTLSGTARRGVLQMPP